jgi:molecular chaperone DnaK (HSP70)
LLKTLLGRRAEEVAKETTYFTQVHTGASVVPDVARQGTVAIQNGNHDVPFSVEELAAYVLSYVKATAELAAGESIRDCVIVVTYTYSLPCPFIDS